MYSYGALLRFILMSWHLLLSCAQPRFSLINSATKIHLLKSRYLRSIDFRTKSIEKMSLKLNITADLQSLFTWNTKQVFVFVAAQYETPKNALNQISLWVWDAIIPAKELAKFRIQVRNKYRFIDQGHNLPGKNFNLTLHWHVIPKTGKIFTGKIVMSGYRLPDAYI